MDELTEIKAMCFDLSRKNIEIEKTINQFIVHLGIELSLDFSEVTNLNDVIVKINNKFNNKE